MPKQVLEDDTDLAMMNLTRMCQSPEDYVPPLAQEVLEDHEEMELLLEAYLQVGGARFSQPIAWASQVRFFVRVSIRSLVLSFVNPSRSTAVARFVRVFASCSLVFLLL